MATFNKKGQAQASRVTTPQQQEPEKKEKAAQQISRTRMDFPAYAIQHRDACVASLQRLKRTPLATLMTLLVIGIAIALPAFLYTLLNNAVSLSHGWDNRPRISLYLQSGVSDAQAQNLATQIRSWPEVGKVVYISPAQGLQEFATQSGLGSAALQLPANPLPGVLEVEPNSNISDSADVQKLMTELTSLSEVEHTQLDMQWLQRLYGMIDVVQTGVYSLALLLGLGVLLIVGNTIRLATQNYHDEIKTIKLVGGTDAFIRRPFLYTGLFYGLFGGVIAWIFVGLTMLILGVSAAHLAALYQSPFRLSNIGFFGGITLLILTSIMGLLGSWFVVNRHLLEIEPT